MEERVETQETHNKPQVSLPTPSSEENLLPKGESPTEGWGLRDSSPFPATYIPKGRVARNIFYFTCSILNVQWPRNG